MKILNVSDMHLRHDRPICRMDGDWIGTQQKTVDWIVQKAVELGCDYIIDNGDTVHVSSQPHTVINIIPNALSKYGKGIKWIMMPGNHSLQYHQIKNIPKSVLSTLNHCEDITVLDCNDQFEAEFEDIPIIHRLMFPNEEAVPWYLKEKGEFEHAQNLLDAYPHHNLILTGDYHHAWVHEVDGRFVVNPGCMLRQTADMIDYQPSVYIIEFDPIKSAVGSIDKIDIPDDGELTSNEHILKVAESEKGIDNFLTTIKEQESLSLDFWDNMEKYIKQNDIEQDIEDIILTEVKPCKTH